MVVLHFFIKGVQELGCLASNVMALNITFAQAVWKIYGNDHVCKILSITWSLLQITAKQTIQMNVF